MLGGSGGDVANQPAVREVLRKAALTRQGSHMQALVEIAKQNKGSWPGSLLSRNVDEYPQRVLNYLLSRKILHPILPVRCPNCATSSPLRPEDLQTEDRCTMCAEPIPLGFAFAVAAKRPEWLYRLAGNVPEHRLSEALPIMAVVNVLSSLGSDARSAAVMGLQMSGPQGSCEIDVALAIDGGQAVVILGEVKSYRERIDWNDLENLRRAQKFLMAKDINCHVLAATLRDPLDPREIADLRKLCEGAESILDGQSTEPLLPIVLSGKDLSAPRYTDDHPDRWTTAGRSVATVAVESCKRNLGLVTIDFVGNRNGESPWRLAWTQ
jgi:hypothetical protein